MKLIDKWTTDNDEMLLEYLSDYKDDGYSLPTYEEVKKFLKENDFNGFEEEVFDDLIIRYDSDCFNDFEFEMC